MRRRTFVRRTLPLLVAALASTVLAAPPASADEVPDLPFIDGLAELEITPDHVIVSVASVDENVSFSLPEAFAGPAAVDDLVRLTANDGTAVVLDVPEPGRLRAVISISGPQAPTSFTFPFALDADVDLQLVAGSVVAETSQAMIVIDPPWAFDAGGRPVPTWFEIDGHSVVQHVLHQGAAYPVVADPSVGFGRYVYIRLSPAEQRLVLQGGPIIAATIICIASGGTACAIAAGAANLITVLVSDYYRARCWVEFKFTYWGTFRGLDRCWRSA